MAIIERSAFFTELANGTKWGAAVSFNRKNPLPLDDKSVFQSLAEAETYAVSATAYPGQIISVLNSDGTNTYYGISQSGTLEELGAKVDVDDQTIAFGDDGETLSLKNFGKKYFKYVAEEQADGTHYVETDGFVVGLEPRVVRNATTNKLELAWYEPNPTTIEGVDAKITTLTQTVNAMDERVTANATAAAGAKSAADAAQADVDALETKVAGMYTNDQIDKAIADASAAVPTWGDDLA